MTYITRDEFSARIEIIETRIDARIESMSAKIDGFLIEQAERDRARLERECIQENVRLEREKAHFERDARYASMAARSDRAMKRLDESMRMVSTIKANYWAATTVHFLGMVAILVGSYYANQSNVLVTMQTTLAMVQSVKEAGNPVPAVSTTLSAE